jgi:hypothetical protein
MKTKSRISQNRAIANASPPGVPGACPLAVVTLAALAIGGCTSSSPTGGRTAHALSQTVLGTAQSFAVLGASTVTNTGATTVYGNLGVDPGLAITGFPPGVVTGGTIHAGDSVALTAQNDTTTAYNTLAGEAPTLDLTGKDLGGMTLTSGVYSFSSSAQLTGTLTLDAQGNPSAAFVFQIGSTLTTASDSSVVVINEAEDCNVFWQVGSSATLGTTTAFKGNILALASITLDTGATVSGRALARTAAVTMDANDVSILSCAAPADAGVDAGAAPDGAVDAGQADAGGDAGGGIDGAVDTGVRETGVDAGVTVDAGAEAGASDATCDGTDGSGDSSVPENDGTLTDSGDVCDATAEADVDETDACDEVCALP